MRLLFVMLMLVSCSIHANISEHFKRPINKTPCQSIPYVDYIYVINLDQRPEKFAHCLEELRPYGIVPYRFSAVNGWQLPLEVLSTLGVTYERGMTSGIKGTYYPIEAGGQPVHEEPIKMFGRNYFSHCMSRGAIGIVLSHLSVLQDAYDSGYETIWVMEDDIQVLSDPYSISHLILTLNQHFGKNGWDVLFTDRDTKDQNGNYVSCTGYAQRPNFKPKNPKNFKNRDTIDSRLRWQGARYGTYSMIVTRSGMKKILDFFKTYKIFLPYDMDFFQSPGIRIVGVRYDIVSTLPKALSDNGGPNYLNKAIQ